LADEYGFTDVDGTRPNLGRFFAERFPEMWNGRPNCGRTWTVAEVPAPAEPIDGPAMTPA
jgi:hypothetical protein